MKTCRIVQHIYEGGDAEPVLTHVFYGKDREEADHIYAAHMKTDAFMRACVTDRRFRDFTCNAQSHVEHLEAGKWVTVR